MGVWLCHVLPFFLPWDEVTLLVFALLVTWLSFGWLFVFHSYRSLFLSVCPEFSALSSLHWTPPIVLCLNWNLFTPLVDLMVFARLDQTLRVFCLVSTHDFSCSCLDLWSVISIVSLDLFLGLLFHLLTCMLVVYWGTMWFEGEC